MYYLGGISQALIFGRQAGKNAVKEAAWSAVVPTALQNTPQQAPDPDTISTATPTGF
jgi:hypothetical protein